MACGQVELTITGMAGEVLANFTAAGTSTVAEVACRLAELAPGPSSLLYRLIKGTDVLADESTIQDAVGVGKVVLRACALPVLSLPLPGVSGVATLPGSGDYILAATGDLGTGYTGGAQGTDEGADCPLWLWRLRSETGWAPEEAVLLTRRRCCTHEELQKVWVGCRDILQKQGRIEQPYEKDELADETAIPYPRKLRERFRAYLHAHDDRYVLVAWNQSDYIGGCGYVDRLDLETLEIVRMARIHDLWGVTTDPRDGTIFGVTCYDGTDVMQIAGCTVYAPDPDPVATIMAGAHRILAQPINPPMEYGMAFVPALGGLVVFGRTDGVLLLICPPDSPGLRQAQGLEGAEITESLRPPADDRTPGDRSSPWVCVRLRRNFKVASKLKSGLTNLYATASGSRITFIEADGQDICGLDLLDDSGTVERYSARGRIAAFGGALGSERPVLIIAHPEGM